MLLSSFPFHMSSLRSCSMLCSLLQLKIERKDQGRSESKRFCRYPVVVTSRSNTPNESMSIAREGKVNSDKDESLKDRLTLRLPPPDLRSASSAFAG
ncbi:hypothetical protein KC358_g88 [Hortaea werneckii]|nr:hypothetical protein KC358_g88 [Hortaea werneckii]